MTFELYMLAGTLVLAFIQILLFDIARTGQYGLKWNTGARDEEMPPLSPVANRLQRAQNNLFETLPLFIGAVLIAHVAGCDNALTHWGALIYLAGRVVYVPLYAFGVPYVRSLAFIVAMAGVVMILLPLLGAW